MILLVVIVLLAILLIFLVSFLLLTLFIAIELNGEPIKMAAAGDSVSLGLQNIERERISYAFLFLF